MFAQRDKNEKCLHRVDQMLTRLLPHTLVLEEFERGASSKVDRITRLCRGIVSMAVARGVEVAVYARSEVQACFASVGARSRHEIAEAIVRNIEALRHKLPPKRKPWQSEDRRMALFAAAALVLTHYQLGASRLLKAYAPNFPNKQN